MIFFFVIFFTLRKFIHKKINLRIFTKTAGDSDTFWVERGFDRSDLGVYRFCMVSFSVLNHLSAFIIGNVYLLCQRFRGGPDKNR